MSIVTRRSGPGDRQAILAVMDAPGSDLSATEKARRGFVQGAIDEEILAGRAAAGDRVFIAEEDGVLAGFAMTWIPAPSGRALESWLSTP